MWWDAKERPAPRRKRREKPARTQPAARAEPEDRGGRARPKHDARRARAKALLLRPGAAP
jgi:hypothetical protein